MVELNDFLDKVKDQPVQNGNKGMAAEVEQFKDNFVYIGTQQFDEATDAMASRITGLAQGSEEEIGKKVIVFVKEAPSVIAGQVTDIPGDVYIASNVLNKLSPELQKSGQVVLLTDPKAVAEIVAREGVDGSRVVVFDDVMASGSQMSSAILNDFNSYSPLLSDGSSSPGLIKAMMDAGVSKFEAGKAIEVDVMSKGTNIWAHTSFETAGVQVNSYYNIKQLRPTAQDMTSSVSSYYSSTDFGFDHEINSLMSFYTGSGGSIERPVLSNIARPYKPGHPDFAANYQKWLKIEQEYKPSN